MYIRSLQSIGIVFMLAALPAPGVAARAQSTASSQHTNLQGDQASWIADPHMHAFYDLTVAAFSKGSAGVDRLRFKRESEAIFRDFAKARGVNPDAMADHLKLIPDQVIQIATDDPKVLSSYDRFVAAVFGPQ
jgi:hypothetical protein